MAKQIRIWVDADACPAAIKEIIFRAAQRLGVETLLVANQSLPTPAVAYIRSIQVGAGFDVADNYIVQHLAPWDLVVTADIPLAAEVIAKGATAINPRGTTYTDANIRQRLAIRNLMEELRSTGMVRGGPAPLGTRDKQAFGNALDRWLRQHACG